jgi:hypothetical protein
LDIEYHRTLDGGTSCQDGRSLVDRAQFDDFGLNPPSGRILAAAPHPFEGRPPLFLNPHIADAFLRIVDFAFYLERFAVEPAEVRAGI